MALQAQLHIQLPSSSSNPAAAGSGRSSLSYPLSSGSHAYDRSSLHHFNYRSSQSHSNENNSLGLGALTSSSNHHSSWPTPTSQQSQGSLYDTAPSTTLPPSSGPSLASIPPPSSDTGPILSSDAEPSGSYGRSMNMSTAMMNSRSTSYSSTGDSHSVHVTTAPMTAVSASSPGPFHPTYSLRSNQAQSHDQSQNYDNSSYSTMEFTTTPPAESGVSQAPPALKSTSMPNSFSSSSLLNPSTDCHMPISGIGQSHSSALTPGLATGTGSTSSTRTSIASTSSSANTPLSPITPLTPVSTSSGFYSNSLSAPTSDVSNGLLPIRVSSSLPMSHEVENYMNYHPDMKGRMHSVSLPTPSVAVNGGNHGLSIHNGSVSVNNMGHPVSAMTAGPTSAPLPARHFSLPSLPHADYRTSQPYSTSPNSLTAPINHIGSDDNAKHAAMMRGHAGPAGSTQSGVSLGLSLGTHSHGLDQNLHHDSSDMASLSQRSLPSGGSSHPHLPYIMQSYSGRPVMGQNVGLGMNMNMGLGLSGPGGFNPGASNQSVAAAAAAAMAMGTGHPGSAAARAAAAAATTTGTSKKHKCKVCDKRFTRPSSLQTHMYSHTGEKPFTCDYENCGRQFSVVSNLRRHKKVHKGVSPSAASSNANGNTSPCVSR
ncbi:Zinc finger, C2H2-type/integrase, DNA-binding protein [Ascosphaera apis ARSEF 7405]|uniref:Zinc finger, C2H2-type/integrase, DNA-binding protein n=1 Tax=Ascosphaera apis ARSEF 7405 TaxID=392613 RepID=A0A168DN31_9EURO|nr:Zinc finger, C2H2-type/integrase, DNA-binding protein [Ascosphaera apis ARSEF 7405]